MYGYRSSLYKYTYNVCLVTGHHCINTHTVYIGIAAEYKITQHGYHLGYELK